MGKFLIAATAAVLASAVSTTAFAALTPAHYYTFEETSGTVLGDLGNAPTLRPGTTQSVAATTAIGAGGPSSLSPGLVGNSFTFDGTNDNVRFAGSTGANALFSATGSFTVSLFIRTTKNINDNSQVPLFASNNGQTNRFNLGILDSTGAATDDQVFFFHSGGVGQINTGISVNDGNWHFLALTRNGTAFTLQIDDTVIALGTSAAPLSTANELYLARRQNSTAEYFNGNMDELRFYNSALGASDIADIRAIAVPDPTSLGLVALAGVAALRRRRA